MTNQALIVSGGDYPVDLAISAWLHAKRSRSQSAQTHDKYASILDDFRRTARAAGFDLDGPARELATLAQGWAARPVAR